MHNLSLLKKLLVTFAVLLVILGGVGYFYYNRWQKDVQQVAAIPYILESSALVCEIESVGKQWENFCETTIGQNLGMLPFFTNIQPSLVFLTQAGVDKNLLDELSLVVSIHGLSEEEIGYVFYLDMRKPTTNVLLALLENQKRNNTYQFETRNYAGYSIIGIKQLNAKRPKTIYMLKQGDYVMLSFSELLIEDIVRGLSYKEPTAFLPIKKTSYKQGSLYINFPKISSLLRIFLKQEYRSKLGEQLIRALPAAQLELKLSNHYLLLNGVTKHLPSSSVKSYWIDGLTKDKPSPFRLTPYIPANCAVVQYYTFKDAEIFAHAMYNYKNKQKGNQAIIAKENHSTKNPLNLLLKSDFGLCTLGSDLTDQLLFIHINNLERAADILEEVKLISEPGEQQISKWSAIYPVNKQVFKNWLPSVVFPDFEPQLLTILDNYIILGSSFAALSQLQKAYTQGNTWGTEHSHQQRFLSSTLESANFSMFINLEYAWPLVTQRLKPAWKAMLDKHLGNFRKFGCVSLQFVNTAQVDQQLRSMNILLAHVTDELSPTPQAAEIPGLSFFQTEAPIISRLFFVETHKKDAPHLLVQDVLHQLYFVDNVGKLVWKKKLEGPILTDIMLIDLYKNNKWQYVVATSDSLHIIDYTGQEVKHYPQRLPQTGKGVKINIIDYSGDKNYRFLITDSRGNIYLRDTQYRPLPGWNPKSLHAPFAIVPFHMRVYKDYFISLHTNGMVYAFNRRGQVYPGFPIKIQENVYNPLVVQKGNSPSTTDLVILTEEGKLYTYNLVGALQNKLQLPKTDYTARFILCPELGSGRSYAIVRQDLDKVAILDEQGNLLFEKKQEGEQTLGYQYYVFGNYKFYVITDPVKKKTYVYDRVGKAIHRAPLSNSGQDISLFFTEATRQLLVYTRSNKSVLRYELTVEEDIISQGVEDQDLSAA